MNRLSDTLPSWITSAPEYQEAKHFKENIKLAQNADHYKWVWEYAAAEYERRLSVWSILDEKADTIIKYLGGGTGLFTLGALASIREGNAILIGLAIPAVVTALFSVLLSLVARIPRPTGSPPSVKGAFEFADTYGSDEEAKAIFLGQWHQTCETMQVVNGRKAMLIVWSTWLYLAALFLLLLPLIVAVCTK
jgi:hypothetical protein